MIASLLTIRLPSIEPRMARRWLALSAMLATLLGTIPAEAASPIEGLWQLVDVAPQDGQQTDPRGIVNSKYRFDPDGKVYVSAPDRLFSASTPGFAYEFNGARLKMGDKPGGLVLVAKFPEPDTMLLTLPRDESARTLRRLAGPDVELEPLSLEVVKTNPPVPPVSYDGKDYSALAVIDRIQGIWEVQEVQVYSKAPDALPPYGFLNDIWTIGRHEVSILVRYTGRTVAVPLSVRNGILDVPVGAFDAGTGSFPMAVSFNRWGHLVVHAEGIQLTLKLVSKATNSSPNVPLKVTRAVVPSPN